VKVSALVVQLVRAILKAERLTAAGRLNALGLAFMFALILAAGVGDLLQSLIRIARPHYSTGLPNLAGLLAVFGGLFLVCVAIIAVTDRGREG